MLSKVVLFLIFSATAVLPASAKEVFDGNDLLKYCEGNDLQKATCDGYLQGASDTMDYIAKAMPSSGLKVRCVPIGTRPEMMRGVMVRMLHLGLHNEAPAASLVMAGFSAVWRCNPSREYSQAEEMLRKAISPK